MRSCCRLSGFLCCTVSFASVAAGADHAVPDEPPRRGPVEAAGCSDVIIGFDRTPGPAEQDLVRQRGGQISFTYHIVPAIAASFSSEALAPFLSRDGATLESAVRALLDDPRVTRVEPDLPVWIYGTELDNTWGVRRIGAGQVHQRGVTGATVKVAVLDTGINYNHPDLAANYAGGWDFVNNDPDPWDDHGHGTHVSGTVAALWNGVGVVGVAPEARIYAVKVCDQNGAGCTSRSIAGIQWCVDNGIQVTNNSYGRSSDTVPFMREAFDNAYAAGLLHVAAAGNSGNAGGTGDNVLYPARYDSVIAVAATDINDNRASFSSTGPAVELAAPGRDVNSTTRNGGYGLNSGTSMASPHVAGVAALLISRGVADRDGNGRTNDEVRVRMQETAEDFGAPGRDPLFGFGLVNANAAVTVPGDLDGDGDVDLSDFSIFQQCFGGSNNPPASTCPPGIDADLDGDGDVDLADFLIFQQNFTGSL